MKEVHLDLRREFRFTVTLHLRLGIKELWGLILSNRHYPRKKELAVLLDLHRAHKTPTHISLEQILMAFLLGTDRLLDLIMEIVQ